jgi:hypothetical protein
MRITIEVIKPFSILKVNRVIPRPETSDFELTPGSYTVEIGLNNPLFSSYIPWCTVLELSEEKTIFGAGIGTFAANENPKMLFKGDTKFSDLHRKTLKQFGGAKPALIPGRIYVEGEGWILEKSD